jgi:hypothetical protein
LALELVDDRAAAFAWSMDGSKQKKLAAEGRAARRRARRLRTAA